MKTRMKTLTLTNADGTEYSEHRLSEKQVAMLSRLAEMMAYDKEAEDEGIQELLCDMQYWSPRD